MNFETRWKREILVFQKKSKRLSSNTANSSYSLNSPAIAVWKGNSPLKDGPALAGNCSGDREVKKDMGGQIGRKEVMLQFRRAMKGSRRIWKNDYVTQAGPSPKQDGFLTYRRRRPNGIRCLEKRRSFKAVLANLLPRPGNYLSNSSKLEVESHSVCGKFNACTENKLLEPSVSLYRKLRHIDIKLERVDDQNVYEGKGEMGYEIHEDGERLLERLMDHGVNAVEGDHFNYTGRVSFAHVKEEEASCSNNEPANSNGDVNSLDNEFKSSRVQPSVLASGDGESTYCQGGCSRDHNNQPRIEDEPCSLQTVDGRESISDRWPKKYGRRY